MTTTDLEDILNLPRVEIEPRLTAWFLENRETFTHAQGNKILPFLYENHVEVTRRFSNAGRDLRAKWYESNPDWHTRKTVQPVWIRFCEHLFMKMSSGDIIRYNFCCAKRDHPTIVLRALAVRDLFENQNFKNISNRMFATGLLKSTSHVDISLEPGEIMGLLRVVQVFLGAEHSSRINHLIRLLSEESGVPDPGFPSSEVEAWDEQPCTH